METVMANKARNTSGKFAPKSETPRKIRSVNLTDDAWQWLADVAVQAGISRNDYLEAMAEGSIPFMETVNSEVLPFMETVETEIKVDSVNTAQQPDIEIYPFMETVEVTEEDTRAEYNALLESSTHIINKLREDVAELRSQLEIERADREEIESQLSELKQNSAPVATLFDKPIPDAAIILSKLRAKRKKSKVELIDLEVILEILEN
jgi:phenylalanyl-tRNA synthetase alpha subunit